MNRARFDLAGHTYVLLMLLLTVYGQLVLKWQMGKAGPMPPGSVGKIGSLLQQVLNPWILFGLVSAFLAALACMAAVTRFDLNCAYPFMSLAFVIVMLFSVLFLSEMLTLQRIVGTIMVVAGPVVIARA